MLEQSEHLVEWTSAVAEELVVKTSDAAEELGRSMSDEAQLGKKIAKISKCWTTIGGK